MLSEAGSTISAAESFTHMRIINGMAISLCISRLLVFAAKFVQNPKKYKFSAIHTGWIIVILLWIIAFWWEYLMNSPTRVTNVGTYILDLFYVFGLFFICVTLTPDDVQADGGYEKYLFERRIFLFSVIFFLAAIDMTRDLINEIQQGNLEEAKTNAIYDTIALALISIAMFIKGKIFQYFIIFLLSLSSLLGLFFN